MSEARAEILERIRSVDRGAAAPVERDYRRKDTLTPEGRVALFCERAGDYRAEIRRVDDVAEAVADVCAARAARRLGIPAGLPDDWLPPGLEYVQDGRFDPGELDRLDGVLTGCTIAIAETGTIVLVAGPVDGSRALTLVPDLHVCVVREAQVVELVPEAMAALAPHATAPITFVSGPSATSDIELSRVEGVHGPRNLVVLVTKQRP